MTSTRSDRVELNSLQWKDDDCNPSTSDVDVDKTDILRLRSVGLTGRYNPNINPDGIEIPGNV